MLIIKSRKEVIKCEAKKDIDFVFALVNLGTTSKALQNILFIMVNSLQAGYFSRLLSSADFFQK